MSLETIREHAHEKRAVEVAIAGGFTLALIGVEPGRGDAPTLQAASAALDPAFYLAYLAPCPCAAPPCTCTPEVKRAYRAEVLRPAQLDFDMSVRLEPPRPAPPTAPDAAPFADTRFADTQICRRIADAQTRTLPQMGAPALDFMEYHRGQLRVDYPWDKVSQIAQTVARLRGALETTTADVAEAVYYRLLKLP